MHISEKGIELIKAFEGFVSTPYRCPAGKLTIGYGHVIRSGEKFNVIDEREAERLLRNDLVNVVNEINKHAIVVLTQSQFDALCSFVYNVGLYNFRRSTLLKLMYFGEYSKAADEFAKWTKANGKELQGLKYRREAEADLFREKLPWPTGR